MANTTTTGRYQELDALRGFAAMFVVFFHLTANTPRLKYGLQLGGTGVDLFFIISGFVIFMSINKVNNSLDFIINRISRLYPTYWAVVTFTFILISVSCICTNGYFSFHSLMNYAANMTMFQFYFRVENLDPPYWTMIIEMLFYIGILLLFQFRWLNHINKIGIAISVGTIMMLHFFDSIYLVQHLIFAIPLLQFFPLFFAGIIFYKIYTDPSRNFWNYLIVILCLACQTALYNHAGISHFSISQLLYFGALSIYFLLFVLFVNNKLKFVVNKTSLFYGKISYALYLSHQFLSIHILVPFFTEKLHINFWLAVFFIILPVIIAIAYFITVFIEVPFRKKMKNWLHIKLYAFLSLDN